MFIYDLEHITSLWRVIKDYYMHLYLHNHAFILAVRYPSSPSSSPCSWPSLSSSALGLWTEIAAPPAPGSRIRGPYPGPIRARRGRVLGAPSPAVAPPTGPAPPARLGLFPGRAPGPGLARASEAAAGAEERSAGKCAPPPSLASGCLSGCRAAGEIVAMVKLDNILWTKTFRKKGR